MCCAWFSTNSRSFFFCHRGCTVDPLNIPPSKRVVFNGYIYATAHFHDVDGASLVEDGTDLVSLGAGFEVAPGDDNDVAVCNAHAWGSRSLAFADNFTRADTSLLENNIAARSKGTFAKFCAKRLQGHVTDLTDTGNKVKDSKACIVRSAAYGLRSSTPWTDILLRKRTAEDLSTIVHV